MSIDLDYLFKPRSIAVVGASTKTEWNWSSGNSWISAALKQGFKGPIYPVHPTAETILGIKAYPTILDIPGEIDLAIFTIPITAVVKVMKQCVEKGVKYIHLLTAGFSETGKEDLADTEKEVLEIAKKGNIRLVGPNCMGIHCPKGGISWSTDFSTTSGSIGLFSQSGQMAYHIIDGIQLLKIYISKGASFGNASDLQPNEFLRYMAEDDETDIICAYLEGLKNGQAFFDAARKVTRKKPLIIYKGGQTQGGSRATLSHTAAIAGSQKIWTSFCKQAGIITANSTQEVAYTVLALKHLPLPKSLNVAILGGAGGGSVTMTDMAEKEGLNVPHLSDDTIGRLEEFIPPQGNSVKNPLDINPFLAKKGNLKLVIELLRDDPNIDALIFNIFPAKIYYDKGRMAMSTFFESILKMKELLEKPLIIILPKQEDGSIQLEIIRKEAAEWFHEAGMATFSDFRLAARVLNNLRKYNEYLQTPNPESRE